MHRVAVRYIYLPTASKKSRPVLSRLLGIGRSGCEINECSPVLPLTTAGGHGVEPGISQAASPSLSIRSSYLSWFSQDCLGGSQLLNQLLGSILGLSTQAMALAGLAGTTLLAGGFGWVGLRFAEKKIDNYTATP